jgi:hypothetical protein
LAGAAVCVAATCAPLGAQDWGDPVEGARVRLGPLGLTAGMTLSRFGIDNNVFNETTNPRSDLSATLQPSMTGWLRLGDGWMTLSSQATYQYYQTFVDQRTLSTSESARVDLPINRIKVFASAAYGNITDRPGPDVDLRAQHQSTEIALGIEAQLAVTRSGSVSIRKSAEVFDDQAAVADTRLADVLNRQNYSVAIGFRQELTPLTTMVLSAREQRTQFDTETSRDNLNRELTIGLSFKPLALIDGDVNIGVLSIGPLTQGAPLPAFTGLTATVNVRYLLRTSTQFGVQFGRSTNYSADPRVPYYVLTTQRLTAEHRFTSQLDLSGAVTRTGYSYESAVAPIEATYAFSGGIGWRVKPELRVGLQAVGQGRSTATDAPVGAYQTSGVTTSLSFAF